MTAWRRARLDRRPTGQPTKVDLRDVFNAILYVNRTGIPWKYLPHDFPNHGTVYAYYAAWRDEGVFAQLNYDLTGLARVKEGRKPEPTASVIDTQSVKTSSNVPLTSQGTDAAGDRREEARHPHRHDWPPPRCDRHRRRPLGERPGIRLLDQAKEKYPTVSKSWVDTGFKNAVVEHGARLGIDVEVVNRNPDTRGFHVVKRRWVVERSIGWLMMHRRLARDYETLTASSEAVIHMDETTPTWRGTY
ncbi:IS5-like element ISSco3 family transposase [Streptomyces echinatus]|uniref:Transposase n=1 Tax=Streptomyces echinatus TaxID=67293 RepID=A0A7W9PR99_9ACTN|nr:transposase [Streptomyces echinatus]